VIWGLLPLSYAFDPSNLRWTLGAADICFKNKYQPVFSSLLRL
jgi:monolysocardiolipin acyltransferase